LSAASLEALVGETAVTRTSAALAKRLSAVRSTLSLLAGAKRGILIPAAFRPRSLTLAAGEPAVAIGVELIDHRLAKLPSACANVSAILPALLLRSGPLSGIELSVAVSIELTHQLRAKVSVTHRQVGTLWPGSLRLLGALRLLPSTTDRSP
jgi:hypothetical protein